MSAMSQLAAERDEEIARAQWEYNEAYEEYMSYMESLHPVNRTLDQTETLMRLESICATKKYHMDKLKRNRWTVTYGY